MKFKKAEITIQTIFFIMMSVFMITIMIFGISKIFLVDEQLSEQDRIEIQEKIKNAISYCDDPLNRGNKKVFEFQNKLFNGVCIINNEVKNNEVNMEYEYLKEIYLDGDGNNIVLIKTLFQYGENEPIEKEIISSFKVNKELSETKCWYDVENTGKVEMNIIC